jgi:hypothetical protein
MELSNVSIDPAVIPLPGKFGELLKVFYAVAYKRPHLFYFNSNIYLILHTGA